MKKQRFSKAIRWKVDSDYTNKLSPQDKAWLLAFQDAEYANNFKDLEQWQPISKATKKAIMDNNNAARRDVYNSGGRIDCDTNSKLEVVVQDAPTLGDLAEDAKAAAVSARVAGIRASKMRKPC